MERQDRAGAWLLPERWSRFGRDILRAKAIDEDRYQNKLVKERLMDAMATPNILALVENASLFSDLDSVKVLGRMGLNRRTPTRWRKGESLPHPRVFFGLLVVGLGKEFEEITFPHSRTIIWEGVAQTLAIICRKEIGRDCEKPSREEFACVRELMRREDADALAPPELDDDPYEQEIIDNVLFEIKRVLRRRFPTGRLSTAEAVLRAIEEWSGPYVLFRLGLLSDWEVLDDSI